VPIPVPAGTRHQRYRRRVDRRLHPNRLAQFARWGEYAAPPPSGRSPRSDLLAGRRGRPGRATSCVAHVLAARRSRASKAVTSRGAL
jgi:hypothetical protein